MSFFLNVLLSLALVNPAPKGLPSQFPLVVGTKWVYDCGVEEIHELITKVEFRDEAHFISIARVKAGGKITPYRVLKLSADGVFEVEYREVKRPRPSCLLKLPVTPNDSWMAEGSVVITRKAEEVEVPAGKFTATRVEWEFTWTEDDGTKTTLTQIYWHAPGIGVVKKQLGSVETLKLKSFMPGKGTVLAK